MADPAIGRMTLEEFLWWDDGTDTRYELPAYQNINSVREILLIDADSHHAELYRRENSHWGIELVRGAGAMLFLASIDLRISMSELYEGIAIPPAEP